MNNEKVYVEGDVVGFTADTMGIREKQIQVSSGDIVDIEECFIHKSIAPEKVKIPQFVAEIIEYYKGQNATLYDGLREKNFNKQYNEWLMNEQDAYDKVARAWLDGYDVEKEKRYIITLKSSEQKLYYHTEHEDYIFSSYDGVFYSEYHTKTDLEENGMSWVFDCPGIEIEEVEE